MTSTNPETVPENTFWHSMPIEEVYRRLGSSLQGLLASEALQCLKRFGRNIIARQKGVSLLRLQA